MATFVQLSSGNWRAVVRRKARYVAETFRRKCDADSWALEIERAIDRGVAHATVIHGLEVRLGDSRRR